MARYWHRIAPPSGLPVFFPTMPENRRSYRWTGLYGIKIGRWFIGAIRGEPEATPSPSKDGREG